MRRSGNHYAIYTDDLKSEQFKEILDVLFKMNGVHEFVNAEKDKRALAEIERIENITSEVNEKENTGTEPSGYHGSERFSA